MKRILLENSLTFFFLQFVSQLGVPSPDEILSWEINVVTVSLNKVLSCAYIFYYNKCKFTRIARRHPCLLGYLTLGYLSVISLLNQQGGGGELSPARSLIHLLV